MSLLDFQLCLVPNLAAQTLVHLLCGLGVEPPDNDPFRRTPRGIAVEAEVRRLLAAATVETSPMILRYQTSQSTRGFVIDSLLGRGPLKHYTWDLPAPSIMWIPLDICPPLERSLKLRQRSRDKADLEVAMLIRAFYMAAHWANYLGDLNILCCIDVPGPGIIYPKDFEKA